MIANRSVISSVTATTVVMAMLLLPLHAAADHGGIGDAFAILALIFVGYSFINFVLVFVNMYLKKRWLRILCIAMLALNVLLLVWLNMLIPELTEISMFVVVVLLIEAFFIYKSIKKTSDLQ
jgi:hypothetical protein